MRRRSIVSELLVDQHKAERERVELDVEPRERPAQQLARSAQPVEPEHLAELRPLECRRVEEREAVDVDVARQEAEVRRVEQLHVAVGQ